MAKNANYVSHKKSKQKNQDGTPQLPLASALVEGEIAINFAENVETLSIKNESGHVVTFSSDNYYSEKKLGSAFTGANSAVTVTDAIEENERVTSAALNDLEANKLDASAYTPTDLTNYYTKSETSGKAELDTAFGTKQNTLTAGTGIDITNDVISVDVDQVIDSGTSASTNAVATKAVYDAIVDTELVWTNAYVTLSGVVSSHTENTNIHLANGDREKIDSIGTLSGTVTAHTADTTIHVTSTDKTNWNNAVTSSHTHNNKSALDAITGSVGTMAYQNANSYSSATEVNTALGNKANTSDLASYADSVKYNSTSHYVEFYHGTTAGTKVFEYDASPFIIDGMVQNVEIKDVTSGGSQVTCLVVSFNTDAGKQDINVPISDIFDANNYYTKSETSGKTEISNALGGKVNTATFTGHTADTTVHFTTGTVQTQIDNSISGKVNTSDIVSAITPSNSASTAPIATKVVAENELVMSNALTDLDDRKLDASAYTEVNASSAITSMAGYSKPNVTSAIATTDTLNQAVGKLECALGGMKLEKITQAAYDALVTKDSNTLYIITD